jgi:hypothetical protein
MSGDLVSLQLLVVSAAAAERELWRAGANFTSVPVKVTEASDASLISPSAAPKRSTRPPSRRRENAWSLWRRIHR